MNPNSRKSTSFAETRVRNVRARRSEAPNRNIGTDEVNNSIFNTLMNDPLKRDMIIQLVNMEKESIQKYMENQQKVDKAKPQTPIQTVKKVVQSPLLLMRRRALQNESGSENNSSIVSQRSHEKLPLNTILTNFRIFVDVKSGGEDCTLPVKILLEKMGATVLDTITRDVTHIIFKDGLFETYEKSKLLKKPLVSLLWVETVRKKQYLVPPKQFPALGLHKSYDEVAKICEKIQKEYHLEQNKNLINITNMSSVHMENEDMLPRAGSENSDSDDIIVGSSDDDDDERLSYKLFDNLRRTPDSTKLVESDLESDCCIVDGESYSRCVMSPVLSEKHVQPVINSTIPYNKSSLSLDDLVQMSAKTSLSTPRGDESRCKKSRKTLNVLNTPSKIDEFNGHMGNDIEPKEFEGNGIVIDQIAKECESDGKLNYNLTDKHKCTPKAELIKNSTNSHEIDMELTRVGSRAHTPNICKSLPSNCKTKRRSLYTLPVNLQPTRTNRRKTRNSMMDFQDDLQEEKEKQLNTTIPLNEIYSQTNVPNVETRCLEINVLDNVVVSRSKSNSTNSKAVDMDLTDDGTIAKGRQSVSTTSTNTSEQFGIHVTHRKPKCDAAPEFKIPTEVEKRNSSLTKHFSSIRISDSTKSTEVSSKNNRISTTSDDPMSALRISTEHSEKSISNMSSLQLSSEALNNNHKKSFETSSGSSDSSSVSRALIELEENLQADDAIGSSENAQTPAGNKRPSTSAINSYESSKKSRIDSAPEGNGSGTKRMRRKLYNPDQTVDEAIKKLLVADVKKKEEEERAKKQSPDPTVTNIISTVTQLLLEKRNSPVTENEEEELNPLDVKKVTKVKRKKENKVVIDPDKDEQKSLLNDVLTKASKTKLTETPIRKSMRINQKNKENESLPKYVKIRRSTMDFLPKTPTTPHRTQSRQIRRKSLVCTRFHRNEVMEFREIARQLGGSTVEDNVSGRTTHLVVGEPLRTINICRAIARGLWILKADWLHASAKCGRWLPEEDYEFTEYLPAIQKCRVEKQTFGTKYQMDVFRNCGPIYVASNTEPPREALEELITLGGGQLTRIARNAAVIIGNMLRHENIAYVKEVWVLDSISRNTCLSVKKYTLDSPKKRTSDHF